ncbi:DUF262 domain-containing protein [Litoribacter alkaliphilus]|uniref:DUF262 domain-containing protein n=1 Tax=Litoribacter ruber TaxID=702568 RepID=A0AAP2CJK9_9BACT|nr:DUF262 domain-containing protein [Litoribacter alkaliphilus]MBS9525946.1 DUF262 domain-containing protein [Litoribacter alkaliphilus]
MTDSKFISLAELPSALTSIKLPNIQRGFAWRPHQIEDFWDSLLRGYPVGSFVISKPTQMDDSLELLLDGQQRATCISLAFNDGTFRDSEKNLKIFVDIDPKPLPDGDSRKYVFRVITKSHPWGYQLADNKKRLTASNIREALKKYKQQDYLKADLNEFYPYEAVFPIPLSFFTSTKDSSEFIEKLQDWCHYPSLLAAKLEEDDNEAKTKEAINDKAKDYFDHFQECLTKQKIPFVYLSTSQDEEQRGIDDLENLFVRLNSSGTPLSADELNYSILKAHLSPDLQNQLEKACGNFSPPQHFIMIAYRLFLLQKAKSSSNIGLRIKPKDFQKRIQQEAEPFIFFLKDLIDGEQILRIRNLLVYNGVSLPFGFPFPIFRQLAPELLFILFYRTTIEKDDLEKDKDLHRRALGIISLLHWLVKKQEYNKLLRQIQPLLKTDSEFFWSSSLLQRAQLNDVLPAIPGLKIIQTIKSGSLRKNTNTIDRFNKKTAWEFDILIHRVLNNKSLVLYNQRAFLAKLFSDEHYILEDTNQPFDWDHIYPYEFFHRKRKVAPILYDWYNSIGNLRAWPYALNRMDSNKTPKVKFYCNGEDPNHRSLKSFRENFPDLFDGPKSNGQLFLEWSCCKKKWSTADMTDLNNDGVKVFELIRDRSLDLITHWYKQLQIDKLLEEKGVKGLEKYLKKKCWKKNPGDHHLLEDYFVGESRWLKPELSGELKPMWIYMVFPEDVPEQIGEGKIEFGLYLPESEEQVSLQPLKEKEELNLYQNDDIEQWIYKRYTLGSHNRHSYQDLFRELKSWLQNLGLSDEVAGAFMNSIKKRGRKLEEEVMG